MYEKGIIFMKYYVDVNDVLLCTEVVMWCTMISQLEFHNCEERANTAI